MLFGVDRLLRVDLLEDELVLLADVQELLLPDQEHGVELVLACCVVHLVEV